jgi:purine-binding chemotaxis protein CheW
MSDGPRHATLEALRAEFDSAFAARRTVPPAETPLLAIRIGAAPYAVRLLEAGGLATAPRIVPVPSRRRELLGVAGLRGEVVPVYSLARIVLGADDGEPPRWLVLARGEERLALAFAHLEGRLVARTSALRPVVAGAAGSPHADAIHPGPPGRPVLALGAIAAALRAS